ncbi:DUF808 domain-containing protein [Vibrio viridaestus]|uniref:DUF808 domain-containing protein n=1 Tax=Vibrio viridaestus TaxID=2487322 RepID=A0A3N9TFM2_9VIBR|nr:DUF808 domain-containing protein [Vibrio viridaestus]RQW62694.1 DUF808 domain-containing protein [Vibrio viridaestus]
MAASSLLTLLDDIATLLDDIAVMSKVAAKKTAGVLGDDLALNAQQVTGVAAERELPVVWKVGLGSLRNKVILVPIALLLSAFLPVMIMPLLILGGSYLCFEGAEKVLEKFFHKNEADTGLSQEQKAEQRLAQGSLEEYEKKKISGAIRTDFILSSEIIVLALGTVQDKPMLEQIIVVSLIAFIMTVGVYGVVAGIVKLDDLGFYLERKFKNNSVLLAIGRGLIAFAPKLMKLLTIVGTLAMFLVGGGIVVHHISFIHHVVEMALSPAPELLHSTLLVFANGIVGLILGLLLVGVLKVTGIVKH